MSLLTKLNELVTPHVLAVTKTQDGDNSAKSSLLSAFYPLFISRLTEDDTFKQVSSLLDSGARTEPHFGTRLLQTVFGKKDGACQLTELNTKLAQEYKLPAETTTGLTEVAAPAILSRIQELSGSTALPTFLKTSLSNESFSLPSWATALLPAGLLAGGAAAFGAAKLAGQDAATGAVNTVSTGANAPVDAVSSGATAVADKVSSGATAVTGAAAAGVGALTGAAATHSTAAHINTAEAPVQEEKKDGFLKSLLPIIGLIIFGGLAWLLLKSCQDKPTPVAAPVAGSEQAAKPEAAAGAAVLAPATLSLSTDATGQAIESCGAQVGSTELLGSIRAAVANVFGTNNCDSISTTGEVLGAGATASDNAAAPAAAPADANANANSASTPAVPPAEADKAAAPTDKAAAPADAAPPAAGEVATGVDTNMPSIEQLPAILGLMKGVPNANVLLRGQDVTFSVDDAAAAAKLVEGAKAALPADFNVTAAAPLDTNAAVATSINSARDAINAVTGTDAAAADALVKALNMQIINFASNSTDIPAENQEILNLAAEKLAAITDAKLAITGHTDNQGAHAYNQKLSESRAAAVRDYLVSKGVATERMSVAGASFDKPVATNATEQGRFQNRRIEFALIQDGQVTETAK